MDEQKFKETFIKVIKEEMENNPTILSDSFISIIKVTPICKIYFEYSNEFTKKEWDTYSAILHTADDVRNLTKIENKAK